MLRRTHLGIDAKKGAILIYFLIYLGESELTCLKNNAPDAIERVASRLGIMGFNGVI